MTRASIVSLRPRRDDIIKGAPRKATPAMTNDEAADTQGVDARPSRIGRPTKERAGEVDQRILDAALAAFVQNGLGGTSIDEIARAARAGKPTIYARYPTKEALFAAVSLRNAATATSSFESFVPVGDTTAARLESLAHAILDRLLATEMIDIMRLGISESRRFPELAQVGGLNLENGTKSVGHALGELARTSELGSLAAFQGEAITETAIRFLDLVIGRPMMRALSGEDSGILQASLPSHVSQAVAFFLAGCRNGA